MRATYWTCTIALAAAATIAAPAFGADGDAKQQSFDRWAADYSTQHNGRISRQAYMDEVSRRWNTMDHDQRGLTPAQVSEMTGHVDSNAQAPLTGTGAQPGNMGPGNSRGK